jgi:chromosome partitioning protein
MRTIAIISQKGGAGNTTLSVHLATAAVQAGHTAAIIDLDPQGTAASWGDRRQADAPEVVSVQAARLAVLIDAARANGANLLILDTAPNADQTALRAAQSADLVLIPCRAATFDLEAIQTTLTLGQLAQKPSYVVLNAVPPRSRIGRRRRTGLARRGSCAGHAVPTCSFHPWRDRRSDGPGVRAGREGRGRNRKPLHVAMRDCGHAHTWTCPKGRMR